LKSIVKEEETNIPYLETQHDIYVFQSNYKTLKGYLVKVFDLIENLNSKLKSKKSDFNLVFTSSNSNFYNEFTERVVAIESLQFILDHFQVMKNLILVKLITFPFFIIILIYFKIFISFKIPENKSRQQAECLHFGMLQRL